VNADLVPFTFEGRQVRTITRDGEPPLWRSLFALSFPSTENSRQRGADCSFSIATETSDADAPVRKRWNGIPQDYERSSRKYKGKRLTEIPKEYQVWSLDNFNDLWPQTRE
jgi:hypothetical protein